MTIAEVSFSTCQRLMVPNISLSGAEWSRSFRKLSAAFRYCASCWFSKRTAPNGTNIFSHWLSLLHNVASGDTLLDETSLYAPLHGRSGTDAKTSGATTFRVASDGLRDAANCAYSTASAPPDQWTGTFRGSGAWSRGSRGRGRRRRGGGLRRGWGVLLLETRRL